MSSPEEIRAEIERTRSNLSENVNTLTDTVKPSNVAKRQADKAKGAVFGVKDKVMGTASHIGSNTGSAGFSMTDSISSAGSSVGGAITGAPGTAKSQASGNPIAAGLIAVGVGWLVGSLLPVSQAEQRAATQVKETATPMVTDAAKTVADHLKEPAKDAVQAVNETATDAASTVKEEGTSAAQDVKGRAADAKDNVQESRNS